MKVKRVNALAERLKDSVKFACPYSTTFLFLEPGCEAIGQGTPLAKDIEAAMKKSFDNWAGSWITPRVDELIELTEGKK